MKSTYVELDGFTVERYLNVDGDVRHMVWEPSPVLGMHFSLMFINGVNMGALTSRDIPESMKAMPYGDARVEAVHGYYDDLRQQEKAIIRRAFPADFPNWCQVCGLEKGHTGFCSGGGGHLVCDDCLKTLGHKKYDHDHKKPRSTEPTILDMIEPDYFRTGEE